MRIFPILLCCALAFPCAAYGQSPEQENTLSAFPLAAMPLHGVAAAQTGVTSPTPHQSASDVQRNFPALPPESGTAEGRAPSLLPHRLEEKISPKREEGASIREFFAYWNMQRINELVDTILSIKIPGSVWTFVGLGFLGLIALYWILYALCDLLDMLFEWTIDRLYGLCVRLYKRVSPRLKILLRGAKEVLKECIIRSRKTSGKKS